ncbi:MAG: AAA family ATPase [Phascolarctobacterium sp.]|nr:MAG: AAA family ATPase [Phascolarctobacterium sp.]
MLKLPAKETLTIEFKSDLKCLSDNDIIDAIVGLANTEGGQLYLGIEDNGTATGLHNNHKDVIKMGVMVANKTVPSLAIRIDIINYGNIPVMLFEIPKSQSIVATSGGKVLKRRLKANGEPENVPMFPYEFNSRLSELGKLDFSKQPLPEATLNDFDENEIRRLRTTIDVRNGERALLELSDEELFKALSLTENVNNTVTPTVTGLLLIGKEESIKRLIPTAESAFQVQEGSTIRVNEISHKPLIATFEFFEQMLKPWNPEREMELGMLRVPIPEFDHRAFREALVNAFSHRDYSILQMTRVIIDEEGMTISNPGAFISGVNLKNLITADPHGRNPNLADALKRIGLAERTGRGIDRIFEGSIIYGRPLPDYSLSDETSVKVFIPRALPDLQFCKMLKEEQLRLGQPFSINQLLVLSALRTNKKLSLHEILDITYIAETKAKNVLNKLIEIGLVEAIGSGRSTNYILSAKVYKSESKAIAYVRQSNIDRIKYQELIMKLADTQGYVTTKDVAELLNITIVQARYLINKLLDNNILIKTGTSRNTKYYIK